MPDTEVIREKLFINVALEYGTKVLTGASKRWTHRVLEIARYGVGMGQNREKESKGKRLHTERRWMLSAVSSKQDTMAKLDNIDLTSVLSSLRKGQRWCFLKTRCSVITFFSN